MDTLKKGTKIIMNAKSDWLTFRYQIIETGEIIELGYYDDCDEIFKGREVKELGGSCKYPSFETELVEDIEILEDYTNTNFRFVYKVGDEISEPEVITEFHKYRKAKLNSEVRIDTSELIEALKEEGVDIDSILDSVTEDEETCIVKTEDGTVYFFDILES